MKLKIMRRFSKLCADAVTAPLLVGCVIWSHISFSSSLSSNSYNVYANPNMEIINPSDNVLDLDIVMSSNCSFEFHIQNLCKKNFKLVWLDLMNLYHQR